MRNLILRWYHIKVIFNYSSSVTSSEGNEKRPFFPHVKILYFLPINIPENTKLLILKIYIMNYSFSSRLLLYIKQPLSRK